MIQERAVGFPEISSICSSAVPTNTRGFSLEWSAVGVQPFYVEVSGNFRLPLYAIEVGREVELHFSPKLLSLPTPSRVSFSLRDALQQGRIAFSKEAISSPIGVSMTVVFPEGPIPRGVRLSQVQEHAVGNLGQRFVNGMYHAIASSRHLIIPSQLSQVASETILVFYVIHES